MSASQTTPALDASPPTRDSSTDTLSAAYELLKPWLDLGATDVLEAQEPAAVYQTSVVLWRMLFQRLNPRASLRDAVPHFVETAPPELNTNKRLREGRLSTGSASFSDARHRLTLSTARWFEERVAASIIQSTPPSFGTSRVFLSGLRRSWGHDDLPRADAGAATRISLGIESATGRGQSTLRAATAVLHRRVGGVSTPATGPRSARPGRLAPDPRPSLERRGEAEAARPPRPPLTPRSLRPAGEIDPLPETSTPRPAPTHRSIITIVSAIGLTPRCSL